MKNLTKEDILEHENALLRAQVKELEDRLQKIRDKANFSLKQVQDAYNRIKERECNNQTGGMKI